MEVRRPLPGEFYRHFKNRYYQIIGIAKHSETKEEMVVYQALYGDFGMYVRPLSMFVSEVDHVKYPQAAQKYRFEKVDAETLMRSGMEGENTEKAECQEAAEPITENREEEPEDMPNPVLMDFLDQASYEDKLTFLTENRKKLTNDVIDAMAASLDVTVPDGDIDMRYLSLKNCVAAHARYECTRLR